MKTLLLITAQYEENYGSSEYPHWKAKGGQTFSLNVDADFFMYEEETCIDAINLILNKKDDSHNRYTYLSHELLFSGIKTLNDEKFEYYFNQSQTKNEPLSTQPTVFKNQIDDMNERISRIEKKQDQIKILLTKPTNKIKNGH